MDDDTKPPQTIPETAPRPEKKPYVRPTLRRLGSVRELTGASASMGTDAIGMMGM
ncbi:MAG: lasso RiPP family leader peptide-containing protein [Myxococcales bacterium]|nr:lasso RiPP family leader peptide-containing protein [Myxococcales bacterium]